MKANLLGSLQVAGLLVSASYGIGFLFGSGELALGHGMAGAIYGVATALGMLLLASVARPLWAAGLPVWDLFGRQFGTGVRQVVAILSMVWMAGVLAAQIHGGVAIAELLGCSSSVALIGVLLIVYVASMLDLRIASAVFGMCLLSSAAVLLYALIVFDGIPVYLAALPSFSEGLPSFGTSHLLAMVVGVVLLVATGADYQQFVLAAKTSRGAALGCLIAAVCLFVIAFLPPAVVVALSTSGQISDQIANSKHVVPLALQKAAATGGAAWGVAMLVALSAAALGSGAAVVRAMSSALMSGVGGRLWRSNSRSTAVALAVGAVLASRGQGIVETMVSVNIIYIASVGVVLLLLIGRCSVPSRLAVSVMAAGFCCAGGLYLLRWAGLSHLGSDLHALITGLSASGLTLLIGKAMGARSARSASTSRG